MRSVQVYEGDGYKKDKPIKSSRWSIRIPKDISSAARATMHSEEVWLRLMNGKIGLTTSRSRRTIFKDAIKVNKYFYTLLRQGETRAVVEEEAPF